MKVRRKAYVEVKAKAEVEVGVKVKVEPDICSTATPTDRAPHVTSLGVRRAIARCPTARTAGDEAIAAGARARALHLLPLSFTSVLLSGMRCS